MAALEAKLKSIDTQASGAKQKREGKAASKAASKTARVSSKDEVNQHPTILALEKAAKRRKIEMTDEERQKAAHDLILQMKKVVIQDNESNIARKPALQKLLNLDPVTKELRRIPIQDHFIESGGCTALADWLYPLPDGTYPNVKVVSEMLHVVDTMHIEAVFLEKEPKLVRTVKVYAKNRANMPQV